MVWEGKLSWLGDEFALHADICNLGSGFLAIDNTSFLQSTQRPNRLSHIYIYRSRV